MKITKKSVRMANDDPPFVTWSRKLKCYYSAWRVIADREIALVMASNSCCDMRGAIDLAEQIMPDVWRIVTFRGRKMDTIYKRIRGEWKAFDPL